MPYKFPKYSLKPNEPITHDEVTYNLRTIKDELHKLNEHNVQDNMFYDRAHAEPGFCVHVNNDAVEFDPALGNVQDDGVTPDNLVSPSPPPPPSYPRDYAGTGVAAPTYDDTRVTLGGHTEWQTIQTITKFTGNSLLWVLSSFQQQSFRDPDTATCGQYALRIDGTIIDETVAGSMDRTNDPKGETISAHAYPFVLDLVTPVPPGTHTIELVGRLTQGEKFNIFDADDYVAIFNRELIVVTVDPPSDAIDSDDVIVEYPEEGDLIDAATVQAGFTDVASDMNNLGFPAVLREGLTADHCPSAVENVQYVGIDNTTPHTYGNEYSYYGDDTQGSPGWAVISDGTTQLFLDTISPIDLSDTTIGGVLVGMDVDVVIIESMGVVPSYTDAFYLYAAFAIQFRDENGDWHTLKKTERYTNGEGVYDGSAGAPLTDVVVDKNANVPIRTWITAEDIAPYTQITGIAGVVASYDRNDPKVGASVTLRACSLWLCALQSDTE